MLDTGDFEAAENIYINGENSVEDDGAVHSIGAFAKNQEALPLLNNYYGTPTPLDDFVNSALRGTERFEGTPDAVRRQAAAKGIQHHTMAAWAIYELGNAIAKQSRIISAPPAVQSSTGTRSGRYSTAQSRTCSPHTAGNEHAAEFGTTGSDGNTALANEVIKGSLTIGREALIAGSIDDAIPAADEVMRNLVIIYSQATISYASRIESAMVNGDDDKVRELQAEGLGFWRSIEAYVSRLNADTDSVNAVFDLADMPDIDGYEDQVRTALAPAWNAIGIGPPDIGTLQ